MIDTYGPGLYRGHVVRSWVRWGLRGCRKRRACAFLCVFFVENGPKTWGNRKCGLRTRVPVLRTRVPNFGYMDGANTEIPGLSRLDLIFSKFSLTVRLAGSLEVGRHAHPANGVTERNQAA